MLGSNSSKNAPGVKALKINYCSLSNLMDKLLPDMRAIWSGAISFGLIHIPVKLYSGSMDKPLSFNLVRQKDLCPIKYLRVCRATGEEVSYEEISRAYQYQKGDYILMHDEDFKKADVRKTQTIEVLDFVNQEEIDPKFMEKPYYLEPAKEARHAYALLVEALKQTKKVGISRFVLRQRERLGFLKPEKNLLVLNQIRYAEDLRDASVLELPIEKAPQREIEMAIKFIDQMSVPFEPQKYQDTYTQDLERIISEKAKGRVPKAKGTAPAPTEVPDIMVKLRQSLEQAQRKAVKSSK